MGVTDKQSETVTATSKFYPMDKQPRTGHYINHLPRGASHAHSTELTDNFMYLDSANTILEKTYGAERYLVSFY